MPTHALGLANPPVFVNIRERLGTQIVEFCVLDPGARCTYVIFGLWAALWVHFLAPSQQPEYEMALKPGHALDRWEIAVAKKLVGEFRMRSRILERCEFDDLVQDCLLH